jgi:glyoxylase-like metal-dependent hydrolase (beta-lactamase superfamily II)
MTDRFGIGGFSVTRVEEWRGRFSPPEHLFADYAEADFKPHVAEFTPDYLDQGMIVGLLQSFIIEADGRTILFDTGAGNDKDRPALPIFGGLDTPFLERMAAAGFDPGAIDLVVCSHLHIDHVGWNTRKAGSEWIPTFPNATYVFPEEDFRVWNPEGPLFATMRGAGVNAGVFEDSVAPIVDSGRYELAGDGHRLGAGLTLRATPGHTPGLLSLHVKNGGESALFVGDVLHHPTQIYHPTWNSVFCEDAEQARASRHGVLELAADTGARLVPAHFAGLTSVFVERQGSGFRPKAL